MKIIAQAWNGAGRAARVGLIGGAIVILGAFSGAAYLLLRTGEQVLFRDLSEREIASSIAELDRMKVPYRIGPDGSTLLVPESHVQTARTKLAGRDRPANGAVGFELFGQGDFGMTDFAQRVNYQRALQGELARTLLSLAEVRDARVHIALPEDGLFRRQTGKAKASVTLTMKPGRLLRPAQVEGIRSLVASAVPGIHAQDVSVIDQEGVALTRSGTDTADASAGTSTRLDLKKELELHLGRKAIDVLERALGSGRAYASVDVTLNMDAVRVTTEDVLPSGSIGQPDRGLSGVLVRERSSTRVDGSAGETREGQRVPVGQRDAEYLAGRRTEQVVVHPGAIRQLQVVAVVREMQDEAQLAKLERLLGATVGANLDRGDTVLVQSAATASLPPPVVRDDTVAVQQSLPAGVAPVSGPGALLASLGGLLAAALLMGVAGGAAVWRRKRARMTESQRVLMLQRMQDWLAQPTAQEKRAESVRRPGEPA